MAYKTLSGRKYETWTEAMEDSGIYLALVTDNFLNDAKCLAQWEYARALGLPFVILQKIGHEKPTPDMLEGVEKVLVLEWRYTEDIPVVCRKILEWMREIGFPNSEVQQHRRKLVKWSKRIKRHKL